MKKTICSILAILFIASLSTLGYAANRSNISIDPPTEDLAIQLAQQHVLEAYEQLSNKMGIVEPDDSRFPNYPNHFGGAYYSDGELVLCITENTEEVREYYTNLIPDFKLIRFEHVTNSYNK